MQERQPAANHLGQRKRKHLPGSYISTQPDRTGRASTRPAGSPQHPGANRPTCLIALWTPLRVLFARADHFCFPANDAIHRCLLAADQQSGWPQHGSSNLICKLSVSATESISPSAPQQYNIMYEGRQQCLSVIINIIPSSTVCEMSASCDGQQTSLVLLLC